MMIRCGVMRCVASCIASQVLLCSALGSGQRRNCLLHVWQEMVSNSLVQAAVSFPDSLPHTLARAGIPPSSWDVLSLEEFTCFLNYLWCCTADGTTALAREYQVVHEAPPFAFDRVQAEKSMIVPFSVPNAPMHLPLSLRPQRRKTPGSPCPL